MAHKAFGFTPEYTLWQTSLQMLNALFTELNYMERKSEDEYIEIDTIDGKKRVKKSKTNMI